MKSISKNIKYPLFLFLSLLAAAYVLSEITKILQKKQISGLTYKESVIKNFVMAGVGEDNFLLKGKKIIDKKDFVDVYDVQFNYIGSLTKIKINSKYARFITEKRIVELEQDITIQIGSVYINTSKLNINLNKKIATNNENVIIRSDDKMITYGKNIFIDIKTNTLKLKNVKTMIRGS